MLVIGYAFPRREQFRGSLLLFALAAMALMAVALDKVFETLVWNTILVRRAMVFPGVLALAYVSVFSEQDKGGFAGSFVFWKEPPGRGPSFIVGEFLTGNPLNNANVGLFGHGYYNYGYLGIFIEGLVLVLLLGRIFRVKDCRSQWFV